MLNVMTSYAVGILQDVKMGPPIVDYLERIDATLAPFDGHFIVHGGQPDVLEGTSPGTLIVLEFPDRTAAEEWYASDAYQAILPLRTENAVSNVFLIDGVDRDHLATDVLR
jgi:uncharacterized protein (DUF1330 family)